MLKYCMYACGQIYLSALNLVPRRAYAHKNLHHVTTCRILLICNKYILIQHIKLIETDFQGKDNRQHGGKIFNVEN